MSRRRAASSPAAFTGIHLALAFLLEVALLAGTGYWGFRGGFVPPWSFVIGIGLPCVLVVLWAIFMAPKAGLRLPMPWQPAVALMLFVLSGVALMVSHQPVLGSLLVLLAVGNTALGLYLARRE